MNPQIFLFKHIYPRMRYFIGLGRRLFKLYGKLLTAFIKRPSSSNFVPDRFTVHNTVTTDSDIVLHILSGQLPKDIAGSLFFAQCLGSPEAYMVGHTNILRIDFSNGLARLKNRKLWTPAAIARSRLEKTMHRFDYLGLIYLSPGLGMHSYAEGICILPDGRIAVTSDIDRPWIIDSDSLRASSPIGRRDEWMPTMEGSIGEILGNLFAAYSGSHALAMDHHSHEVFLVNYQLKQANGEHPVDLILWTQLENFKRWRVLNEDGQEIEIKQSIHELVLTRNYIIITDTAFAAGKEMLTPWVNFPLPNEKTIVYAIDRRELSRNHGTIKAKRFEVDKACIHLVAEYDNPDDRITAYMLHTPGTNTAEIIGELDRDIYGKYFPKHLIGYGPLPVLDISSIGKHVISASEGIVNSSEYLSHLSLTWGPYLYSYFGKQLNIFQGQDLFVMFKGFSREILPERIIKAYHKVSNRQIKLSQMFDGNGLRQNSSICRIETKDFEIKDSFIFPDRVHLYSIACLEAARESNSGYILGVVVTDEKTSVESSGHEYWLFAADNLSKGPICKMGNNSLNNSTLFHSAFIPDDQVFKGQGVEGLYHVSMRADYPSDELLKWNKEVQVVFKDFIWPYFDKWSAKFDLGKKGEM